MTKDKGDYFETKACEYLVSKDFLLVERNFFAKKLGEIDIVATKDGVYHFVEVKSGEGFEAIYNITPSKLGKLKRSVEYYLQVKKLSVAYCIDAIIFSGEELEFLENITL
jgi:putative endonuclease